MLKESGIPLTIGIRNPNSTNKESMQNPVSGIWNLGRGIQNPRLPWIPLYGPIGKLKGL